MLFLRLIYSDRQNLSCSQSAVSAPLPSRSGFMLLECSSNRQYHGKSHWLRGVLGRDARPLFRLKQSSLELKHFLTSDLRYSVQWLGSTPTAPFLSVSSFIIANKVLTYFLCSFFSVFLFVISFIEFFLRRLVYLLSFSFILIPSPLIFSLPFHSPFLLFFHLF